MSRKTKSKKTKVQKRLRKIDDTESERLGASSVVYTHHFTHKQSFGAASGVRHISPEDYLRGQ